jgi:hypothetical protein
MITPGTDIEYRLNDPDEIILVPRLPGKIKTNIRFRLSRKELEEKNNGILLIS